MRFRSFAGFLSLAFFCTVALSAPNDPPEGLELIGEKIAGPVYPYQAARLRLVLRNTGKDPLGNLPLVESRCVLTDVKCPSHKGFEPIGDQAGRGWVGIRTYYGKFSVPYFGMLERARITLKPGESFSVSAPYIHRGPRGVTGLFLEPGEYGLSFLWKQEFTTKFDLRSANVAVRVEKPDEDGAAIVQIFEKHPKVAEAYFFSLIYRADLASDRPEGQETVKVLEGIIKRYPKSSYADYARFLMARHLANKEDAVGKPNATEAEIAAARAMLEAIDVKKFAHGPDTLLTLRRLHQYDQAKVAKIDAELQSSFRDAIEWLEFQAGEMRLTLEQIMEKRGEAAKLTTK